LHLFKSSFIKMRDGKILTKEGARPRKGQLYVEAIRLRESTNCRKRSLEKNSHMSG